MQISKSLLGNGKPLLRDLNESPNLGQRTRPRNNQQQQKKEKENLWIRGFAVHAHHRMKIKEIEKTDRYVFFARELKKKTIAHEGEGDTNYNWCT